MTPLVGLQTGWVPQQGLMGNVLQQPTQQGLMGSGTIPSLQGVQPGDWSSVAYNMAGRPIQGPSPTAPGLPMPAGVSANGSTGSSGSSLGGTALGILGALAKNPSLLKSAGSGVSSLWNSLTGGGAAASGASGSGLLGSGATAYGTDAGVTAGVSPLIADDVAATTGLAGAGLAPVGVDAVSELPSVSAAVNAAGSGAAAGGGLLGAGAAAGSGAIGTAGANALAASGGFATGGAAGAGGGSAAAGGAVGPLGAAAAVAAPFIFQQAALALGDAWTKKNTQGNAAMKGWMQSTGATWKPNYTNSGQNTFGTNNGLLNASSSPGTMYDKSGKAMTPAQAANAIYTWATQNGVNPGDFHPG